MFIPLQQIFFSLEPLPQDLTWGLAVLVYGYHQDDIPFFCCLGIHTAPLTTAAAAAPTYHNFFHKLFRKNAIVAVKVENLVKRLHFTVTKHSENSPGSTATLMKVHAKQSLASNSRCKVYVEHVSPKMFCVTID